MPEADRPVIFDNRQRARARARAYLLLAHRG